MDLGAVCTILRVYSHSSRQTLVYRISQQYNILLLLFKLKFHKIRGCGVEAELVDPRASAFYLKNRLGNYQLSSIAKEIAAVNVQNLIIWHK